MEKGEAEARRWEGEVRRWEAEARDWRARAGEAEEQLREKLLLLANQVKATAEAEERATELSRQLSDMEFACHSQVVRAE